MHHDFFYGIVRPMQSCQMLVKSPNQQNEPSIFNYEKVDKITSLYFALQKATHALSKDGYTILRYYKHTTTINIII